MRPFHEPGCRRRSCCRRFPLDPPAIIEVGAHGDGDEHDGEAEKKTGGESPAVEKTELQVVVAKPHRRSLGGAVGPEDQHGLQKPRRAKQDSGDSGNNQYQRIR